LLHKQLKKQQNKNTIMKKIAAFILFIGVLDSISAQSTLTLDSCRALALSNNKELRISAEKITAAHYEKKAAFTNYLPKIAAARRITTSKDQ
jgi:outer membrane protein